MVSFFFLLFFFFFTRPCANPSAACRMVCAICPPAGTFSCIRCAADTHLIIWCYYCYILHSDVLLGRKKPKVWQVYMYMMLYWHWVIKKRTELRCDDRNKYSTEQGPSSYLLHQNVDGSGYQFVFPAGSMHVKVSGCSAPSVRIALPFLFWWSLTLHWSVRNGSQRERKGGEKKKSSQSCWLLSLPVSSNSLKLLIADKTVFLNTTLTLVHRTMFTF